MCADVNAEFEVLLCFSDGGDNTPVGDKHICCC